jgi:hypothetical protein
MIMGRIATAYVIAAGLPLLALSFPMRSDDAIQASTRSIPALCRRQAHLNPPGVGIVQTPHDYQEERVEVANVRNARPRCGAHCADCTNECEF